MKIMERNKQPFWYMLYDRAEAVVDEYGNESGEKKIFYKEAVLFKANISAAGGTAQMEQFGNLSNYDKVIVTDDVNCPIDENTVLFVDKKPEYKEDGSPVYDYIVMRVAKSLNSRSYAIQQVSVS